MKICFEVLKEDRELIEELKEVEGVTVRDIRPIGATEYIAIFVPLAVVIVDNAPAVIQKLMEKKKVIIKYKGITINDVPYKAVETLKKQPGIKKEIRNMLDMGEIEIIGNMETIDKTQECIYRWVEKIEHE